MVLGKKIGIIILNYNDYKTTEQLCKRIMSYKLIDIITIVDNNSTDNSWNELSKLSSNKTIVIKTDKNGGYSYGNNYGCKYLIDKHQIDILFISNPDVIFDENFIERIVEDLSNEQFHAASGLMINKDGSIGNINVVSHTYIDDVLDCTLLIKKLYKKKRCCKNSFESDDFKETNFLSGSLFAISSKAFLDIGGFDENVFLYCEERIMASKFKLKNYRMIIDSSVTFIHNHSVTINKSLKKVNQVKYLYKSRIYYYKKYTSIGRIKLLFLYFIMGYGVYIRRIIYGLLDKKGDKKFEHKTQKFTSK